MNPHQPPPPDHDGPIREHVYDGIAEYDKRLPNWWLITLYATIIFAIIYWLAVEHFPRSTDASRLEARMARIEAERLAGSDVVLEDAYLWQMSRNPVIVASGKSIYANTCASCHGPNREGGIGFRLDNNQWVHGGEPVTIYRVIDQGVAAMPPWGGLLGPRRVAEVTAYLLSFQTPPPDL